MHTCLSMSTLGQRFPDCGSQPKGMSQSSVKWIIKVFMEIFIFVIYL